jgi:hypothetical protein
MFHHYSRDRNVLSGWKQLETRIIIKFRPILATQETLTNFHGDEEKIYIFWYFFFHNGRLKETEIFKTANSQKNFVKIVWTGSWVSRIDWCKGHLYGGETVWHKLKNSLKNVLGCFWAYVAQPHNHIGWATSKSFASINSTNPRTNPSNFYQKNWRFSKSQFFWVGHFEKKIKKEVFTTSHEN